MFDSDELQDQIEMIDGEEQDGVKQRHLLLTTLGNTFDYTRHHYFHYSTHGVPRYCEGISTAEAGAKYILSNVPVDDIVVLGPSSAYQGKLGYEPLMLRDLGVFGADDPEQYSEYKFFCYRIMQFLNGVDIEGPDLLAALEDQEQQELLAMVADFCRRKGIKTRNKREYDALFHYFDREVQAFDALSDELFEPFPGMNSGKIRWLKHFLFMLMERQYKMRPLSDNEEITVRFLPTHDENELGMRLENMPAILETITGSRDEIVNVYVDLQGMDIADSHTLVNVLFMLQYEQKRNIRIREIITTTYRPLLFTNPIEDQKHRLELSELLSGIDAFLKYGKVDSIRNYWIRRRIKDEHVEKLIYAMQTVDIGISLCNVSELETGIRMLQKVFAGRAKKSKALESMIFNIMESSIRNDYGVLLRGNEINILALTRWAMNKHFYQQAITIIESRVPYDLVRSGVFYYARNEAELQEFVARMNEVYWRTPPKDRYVFDDLEHYFVKFYRRREAYKNKPKNLTEAYVDFRLREVYDEASEIKSYTLYNGKEKMMKEFLVAYLQIANLRNLISHAQEVDYNDEHWGLDEKNETVAIIENTMENFITLYAKVKSGINKKTIDSVMISQEDFKAYAKAHMIMR